MPFSGETKGMFGQNLPDIKVYRKNYFTSSDPHHDMLGEGCQVRVAATQFFFAISYTSSRAAHSAEEHLANNQGQNMSNMFKHVAQTARCPHSSCPHHTHQHSAPSPEALASARPANRQLRPTAVMPEPPR